MIPFCQTDPLRPPGAPQSTKGFLVATDTPSEGAAARQQAAQNQVQIDDAQALSVYANFCRVTGTPEELIIDFGVNSQPFGTQTEPIHVTQRVITNFFTAKRLLSVLQLTVQRHEATFGVLETDVQRRVKRS